MEPTQQQNADPRKPRAGVDRARSAPIVAKGDAPRCPICGHRPESPPEPGAERVPCTACGLEFGRREAVHAGVSEAAAVPKPISAPLDCTLESWLTQSPGPPRVMTDRDHVRRWCRNHHWLVTSVVGLAAVVVVLAIGGTAGMWYAAMRASDLDQQHDQTQKQWVAAQSLAAERHLQLREKDSLLQTALSSRKAVEGRLADSERRLAEAETRRAQAEQRRTQAQQETRLTLAQQPADESSKVPADQPVQSALPAGASANASVQAGRPVDRAVQQMLRDALAAIGNQVLKGHRQAIHALAVSSDGRWLVSASADKTARLWDLRRSDPAAGAVVLSGHAGPVQAAAFSPDRRWLVTAGQDATAILWNLQAADPTTAPVVLRAHRTRINAVAISADSRWLVTGGGDFGTQDDMARLWDLEARDPARSPIELRGHDRPILAVAISPNGRWVITAGEDRSVRLFGLSAKFPAAEQHVLRGHEGWVTCLAVSPDGRWLASGSYDNSVRLWDLTAADPAARSVPLLGHQGWVSALTFSPDGRRLATGSYDTTARLWNLDFNKTTIEATVLAGHEGQVRALSFSPDGQRLVTGSIDKTARIWDLDGAESAAGAVVVRGTGPISSLVVSPDSRWFAAASGDGEPAAEYAVRLWDLTDGRSVGAARAAASKIGPDERRRMLQSAAKEGVPHQ